MNFYKKIINLLNIKGVSQQKMIDELHLARNTMFNWKKRQNLPNGKILLKLSNYFNVSIDFLLDNTTFCLSEDEQLLINKYRQMPPEQQEKLLKNIIPL